MSVKITESANKRIGHLCKTTKSLAVRLAIVSGGCNGFSKVFDMSNEIKDDDIIFDLKNGKLIIDPISLTFLENSIIDFKNDLIGSYFSVDIPEATSSCGCSQSFSI